MKLSFLGGCKEVGRSGILVDTGTEKILMDYGVRLEGRPIQYPKSVNTKLDAILVSHAHLDHQGAIPILIRQGQKCPIYGLEITKPLSRMLWFDSLKIARSEGEEPMFAEREISLASRRFKAVKYRQPFRIGKTRVTFYNAGHIPGSGQIMLEHKGKKILYTGDFNLSKTRLIPGADPNIPETDILITESTYSDREHPNRREEEKKMVEMVEGTIANEGSAIIACFAISRSQEILLVLDAYGVKYPIYIDGMAKESTKIIQDHPHLQRQYNILGKAMKRGHVKFITHPSQRKKLMKKPSIVITTSGMLSGGPVVHYIEKLHQKEECSLIMTGFQIPGTEGANLLQTGRYIHDDSNLNIKMSVKRFNFSSHAPKSQLLELMKRTKPKKVFCVHGDRTDDFARELREWGIDASSPSAREVYPIT